MPQHVIRPLLHSEIQAASDLADSIYQQELWESFDAFERKYILYAQGALGCFDGDRLIGYVLSHPWRTREVVPIGTVLETLPASPDCYYIHDCAVAKESRGRGVGRQLAQAAIDVGKDAAFKKFLLVSVNQSDSFWEALGFKSIEQIEYAPRTVGHKMVMVLPDNE